MNAVEQIHSYAKQLGLSNMSSKPFGFLDEPLSNEAFLVECLKEEVAYREERAKARRIKQARLPTYKGFDEFDMTFKIHSHLGGETTQASAPPLGTDMSNLNDMSWRFFNKQGANYSVPPHYIYHPNSKSVLQYSIHPYSRGTSVGTATTGVGLRRALGLIK